MTLQLHGYFRSSAAYRVRIALELKGLQAEHVPVHLLRNGGEQNTPEYARLNPAKLVPTLVDDGLALGQSMAIIEYLDEAHAGPALLPADPAGRARVRGLAQTIACDVHPLNNLRVLRYLVRNLGVSDDAKNEWIHHWIGLGLAAYDDMIAASPHAGRFSYGDTPTLADICLVPQLYNAERFDYDVSRHAHVQRIYDNCAALPEFQRAHPSAQPDAN